MGTNRRLEALSLSEQKAQLGKTLDDEKNVRGNEQQKPIYTSNKIENIRKNAQMDYLNFHAKNIKASSLATLTRKKSKKKS